MSGRKRYERAVGSLAGRKVSKPEYLSGLMGVTTNGENQIEVPGRPGFVWVRLRNQLNELVQVFNDGVSLVFDLPVLVVWDQLSPTHYKIIGRDTARYINWGSSSSYEPVHAAQHSFDTLTGIGGGDVVWVYDQQIMPFLVTPSGSSGAMSVSWQPDVYYMSGTFHYWGGTGTAIGSDLKPTGTITARMFLLYADVGTGNLLIATGSMTEFDASITGMAAVMAYMPSLVSNDDLPMAGLRLVTGTSEILWPNLYDVRQFF